MATTRYVPAGLRGGPLDGLLVQAPVDHTKLRAQVIGLPIPVPDEQSDVLVGHRQLLPDVPAAWP